MGSIWTYDDAMGKAPIDLVDFDVEATDGHIGRVDEASDRAGFAYLVVDTGFWIFGKKRLLPAGIVRQVNENERKVHVSLSKGDIRSAPDFDDQDRYARDEAYDAYYGAFGGR